MESLWFDAEPDYDFLEQCICAAIDRERAEKQQKVSGSVSEEESQSSQESELSKTIPSSQMRALDSISFGSKFLSEVKKKRRKTKKPFLDRKSTCLNSSHL